MLNELTIIGRITKDAQVRKVMVAGQETSVVDFSVAVNKGDKVTYFVCTAWRELADSIGTYGASGRLVYVSGEVGIKSFMGRDNKVYNNLSVNVQNFKFLDQKREIANPDQPVAEVAVAQANDDVIPF